MPRHYKPRPPRPASIVGLCGHEVEVKATGAWPRYCLSCRAAREKAARAMVAVAQVDVGALPAADAAALGDRLKAASNRAKRRGGAKW